MSADSKRRASLGLNAMIKNVMSPVVGATASVSAAPTRSEKVVTLSEDESKKWREQALGIQQNVFRPRPAVAHVPRRFGTRQSCLATTSGAVLLVLGLLILAAFFGMPLGFYQVYIPESRHGVAEINPNVLVSKSNMVMYAYPQIATTLRMNLANRWLTKACGDRFRRNLTNSEKNLEILTNFISLYDIDMTLYEREDYMDYVTVNDWFSRKIKLQLRPVANVSGIVVAPADARYVIYNRIDSDLSIWLKGEKFSSSRLITGKDGAKTTFEGGSMMIARLAPQDYHRFHSPVEGTVTSIKTLPGRLHSVNADGMRSANGAIFNVRTAVLIDTPRNGLVAFVAIGAVCVGSVTLTAPVGTKVMPGDELGYFEFGGSTTVVLFQKGAVVFDQVILDVSHKPVESLLEMGMTVGNFVTGFTPITP